MLFSVWINEVLDLSHSELPHSEETLLRMDLISEAEADLGSCKGHSTVVEVKEPSKVNEDALSRLWPQVTFRSTRWTDLGLKHEIERNCIRQVIICIRRLNL